VRDEGDRKNKQSKGELIDIEKRKVLALQRLANEIENYAKRQNA